MILGECSVAADISSYCSVNLLQQLHNLEPEKAVSPKGRSADDWRVEKNVRGQTWIIIHCEKKNIYKLLTEERDENVTLENYQIRAE